jgi:hypothetical protein
MATCQFEFGETESNRWPKMPFEIVIRVCEPDSTQSILPLPLEGGGGGGISQRFRVSLQTSPLLHLVV